ncbi:hypothetical protein BGZ49_008332 [Haplosporangium sp. Z 27]|nr:hypothetical protein BGZ49_008332 [Haplosporangium sp. Z 27]
MPKAIAPKGEPQVLRPVYMDDFLGTITPFPRTINVQSRYDHKAEEFTVLWNDIKLAINNPIRILNKDTVVPFLTDENLQFLEPHRISYHPGVILNVVVEKPKDEPSMETQGSIPLQNTTSTSSAANTTATTSALPTSTSTGSSGILDSLPPPCNDTATVINNRNNNNNNDNNNNRQDDSQNHEVRQPSFDPYERGMEIYQKGDYPNALLLFHKAVRENERHVDAYYQLGLMYHHGLGTAMDRAQSLFWYRKAANQGDARAQNAMGIIYETGFGVPKNNSLAWKWYEKAASQGNSNGQCNLAEIYYYGKGVAIDYYTAESLFRKSAMQGNAEAQFYLGLMYENGEGVTRSYSRAAEWYKKSEKQGHLEAKTRLAEVRKLINSGYYR